MSASTGQTYTLTPEPRSTAETAVTTDDALLQPTTQTQEWKDEWQKVIDDKLIDWGGDSKAVEEEDLIPPTEAAVHLAGRIAITLRDDASLPPKRVVPDGDGGIVFERWEGPRSISIEISNDGTAEIVYIRAGQVEARETVT